LDLELQQQGDLANDKRKALTVLVQQFGIPYFDGRKGSPVGVTEEQMYLKAQQKLDQFEQDRVRLKIQINNLLNTAAKDLLPTAAGLELPENRVSFFYKKLQEAQREIEEQKAQGIGPTHPSIVTLQKRATQFEIDANMEVASLKKILSTRLQLVERQVERMREMVTDKKEQTVDLSMRQHQYNNAREEYEQARELLKKTKIQQQQARILLKMPRSPLTIHGYAE
jgi:succinoglycan biosynthesis transport protein ExoP